MPELVPEDSQTALGDLPAGIRRHLLSTLEYDGLKALVHASPVYHQQYLLDRQHLLCQCLEKTLGKNTVDAFTVYQSDLEFSETLIKEKVPQFLDGLPGSPFFAPISIPGNIFTLDEVISIVTFRFSIIKPLVHYYISWALEKFAGKTKDPQSPMPEGTRLVRALYRFQLWCNVFGAGPYRFYSGRIRPFSPVEILKTFMDIYESWEVEELVCIHTFTKEMVSKVFDDIYWDVHPDNPMLTTKIDRPPAKGHLILLHRGSDFLERTLSRELELLHDVLFKIKDHTTLAVTMQEQITLRYGIALDIMLGLFSPQSMWREQYTLRSRH